jgi:hypothetical protein
MKANSSRKKKIIQEYKTANYYARAIVFGLLLWFASILILSISGIGGQTGNISFVASLIVCMVIGYFINKLTWKYMLVNKL